MCADNVTGLSGFQSFDGGEAFLVLFACCWAFRSAPARPALVHSAGGREERRLAHFIMTLGQALPRLVIIRVVHETAGGDSESDFC